MTEQRQDLQTYCSDLDFTSTDYEIRPSRCLSVRPRHFLLGDHERKTISFREFTVVAVADDPRIQTALVWHYELNRRRSYKVDFEELREFALEVHAGFGKQGDLEFADILDLMALHHVLVTRRYHCALEKPTPAERRTYPKNAAYFCLYQAANLVQRDPLNPLELAWLVKP